MGENAIDRMWKTLGKHTTEVQRPPEPPPKPPREQLQWKAPLSKEQSWRESTNGRYRIAKVLLNGKPLYEVYRLAPQREWWFCVAAGRPSFDDAKAVAQRDWERE